jgi:hypothetical protein
MCSVLSARMDYGKFRSELQKTQDGLGKRERVECVAEEIFASQEAGTLLGRGLRRTGFSPFFCALRVLRFTLLARAAKNTGITLQRLLVGTGTSIFEVLPRWQIKRNPCLRGASTGAVAGLTSLEVSAP